MCLHLSVPTKRVRVEKIKCEGESSTIVRKKGCDLARIKKNMCMIIKLRKCLGVLMRNAY